MSAPNKSSQPATSEILTLIHDFPLFKGFPDNLALELAQAAELIDIAPNTQILQQGQMNEHLYFLIAGQVGVYVDGRTVSKLQRKGDLLGEMSVISNRPVAATILSETAVTLLRIDSRVFLEMHGPERDLYLSILYRIYATVLTEKLNTTNQKAKHFEDLTTQLQAAQAELKEINQNLEQRVEERTVKLEQKNAELWASRNRLEEMINTRRLLWNKLIALRDTYLVPLKVFLDGWRKVNPENKAVTDARTVVFEVQQLLASMSQQFEGEQAMRSKRVLLVDGNKKQQVMAKMALGGSGVELDMASTLDEGRQLLADKSYDLVFLDSDAIDLAEVVYAKGKHIGLVLMTSNTVPSYVTKLKSLSRIPDIVSRDEGDRTFTIKNIMTTATKLLSRDLFGLDKYLMWGVEIQHKAIFSSRQRADLITEVDEYFADLGIRRANRDRIRAVAEELLMNAIYDAPTGPDGKALYNHMKRTEELILQPQEQGLCRFATDGMFAAVSVQDPFGSLSGNVILKYLEHNYAGHEKSLNEGQNKGGAGRGLHQIVENADLVVFNVEPGKRTEVIALFNVEVKQQAHQNPSFHLFIRG